MGAVEAATESATEILLGEHVVTDVGGADNSMLEATLMTALTEVEEDVTAMDAVVAAGGADGAPTEIVFSGDEADAGTVSADEGVLAVVLAKALRDVVRMDAAAATSRATPVTMVEAGSHGVSTADEAGSHRQAYGSDHIAEESEMAEKVDVASVGMLADTVVVAGDSQNLIFSCSKLCGDKFGSVPECAQMIELEVGVEAVLCTSAGMEVKADVDAADLEVDVEAACYAATTADGDVAVIEAKEEAVLCISAGMEVKADVDAADLEVDAEAACYAAATADGDVAVIGANGEAVLCTSTGMESVADVDAADMEQGGVRGKISLHEETVKKQNAHKKLQKKKKRQKKAINARDRDKVQCIIKTCNSENIISA